MIHTFYCQYCNRIKSYQSDFTTGYSEDDNGNKICFSCCKHVDIEYMRENDKITLYLTGNIKEGFYISNWPGSLKIRVFPKKGNHNITGSRYDVWFSCAGKQWWGVQYGELTQLCHCKASKNNVKIGDLRP